MLLDVAQSRLGNHVNLTMENDSLNECSGYPLMESLAQCYRLQLEQLFSRLTKTILFYMLCYVLFLYSFYGWGKEYNY